MVPAKPFAIDTYMYDLIFSKVKFVCFWIWISKMYLHLFFIIQINKNYDELHKNHVKLQNAYEVKYSIHLAKSAPHLLTSLAQVTLHWQMYKVCTWHGILGRGGGGGGGEGELGEENEKFNAKRDLFFF